MQKVPYVQRIKRKDGRVDLYFRKGDFREGPLSSPDGSEELQAEVQAILKRIEKAEAARVPKAGTVGGMLKAYNKSAEFLALARSTQKEYQRLIDELDADCGDIHLREIDTAWLRDMRDAWAVRGYKAANDRMQVLKIALSEAVDDGRIDPDPFGKVKKARRPHETPEAHPTWEDAEVEAAIEDAIERKQPGLARAIALGRWGGFRRGTICGIPLNARTTGHDDNGIPHHRLYWITQKRKVLADKREDPRLTALLERTPNKALTLAYNSRNEQWQPRQLNQALDRLLDRLAKAGKVRAAVDEEGRVSCPLTIHGLRHARGVELALAGASDAEIMSQLEHASDRAAKIYRRQAERRKLADAGQDRVDRVVSLKAAVSRQNDKGRSG